MLIAEWQIHVIKARRKMPKPFLNVGVYCRVSTPSQEQLHSLAAQVSHFVRKYHVYIIIACMMFTSTWSAARRRLPGPSISECWKIAGEGTSML